MFGCEHGEMKRNEGVNEQSGVKDTVAVRTQTQGVARNVTNCELCETSEGHCSYKHSIKAIQQTNAFCCNGLAHYLPTKPK